jgi:hypothetical protein
MKMADNITPLPRIDRIGSPMPFSDYRAETSRITSRTPIDPIFRAAFLHSKIHILKTHPTLSPAQRMQLMTDFAPRLGAISAELIHQPVPGGVGYGTYFDPNFKTSFDAGTEITWNVVCPPAPGGNVNNYLYITSTNRSSLGVEALVSYSPGGQLSFMVYDWAQTSDRRWQVNLPDLSQYFGTQTYNGQNYRILSIWNSTSRTAPQTWRNSVFLFDRQQRNDWVLVYQFDYPAADAAQKADYFGSWGPIVETFQSLFSGTNPMGALNVQLRSANPTGNWGEWSTLGASQSIVRTDNVGFHQTFLDPDFNWIITS